MTTQNLLYQQIQGATGLAGPVVHNAVDAAIQRYVGVVHRPGGDGFGHGNIGGAAATFQSISQDVATTIHIDPADAKIVLDLVLKYLILDAAQLLTQA